jgi:hypothetical protein
MGTVRVGTRLLTAVTAGAAITIGMAGVGGAVPAASGSQAAKATHAPLHAYTATRGGVSRAAIDSPTAGATIPLWTSTVTAPGGPYTYSMVGQSPFVHVTNPLTVVPTQIIPVVFHFPDGTTSNPKVADACSGSLSAKQLTLGSPILKNHAYNLGGTNVGTGQYLSEFQRANFWSAIQTANNPTYGVKLKPTTNTTPITVTFSATQTAAFAPLTDFFGSAPCGHLWQIDYNSWGNYVQNTLIPSLAPKGVGPTTFPIFLFYNVVLYDSNPNNCCILGFHGAYTNGSGSLQTYSTTEYDTEGGFGPNISDTSIMAHEVGEWMDDPTIGNPVPAWGHIGQQSGCQGTLEVGDPLTGNNITVLMTNGHTYHLQELAFFSWFYDQTPSIAVNGWYSSNNTFTADAATIAGGC